MTLPRHMIVAVSLAGFFGNTAAPLIHAADRAPSVTDARTALTAQSFASLHKLIRPQDGEWRHLEVNWMTDIVPVRKKAAAEDKPIVVLYTGGAGYNEPLGVC
jgi:hypothetical protein